MTHKKLKIILSIVVSVFVVLIVAVVGGVWYMNNKFNQDMIRIANSEQAKKIYEDDLKSIDKKAFTKQGKIHSYKINQNSISHNPMGGIDVDLIINNNKKLDVGVGFDSENDGKTLTSDDVYDYSEALDKMLEK